MRLVAELPAHVSGGAIEATLKINGHQVQAGIATGVGDSEVAGWALKELGLTQHPIDATVIDPKGYRTAFATTIDKLELGALTVKGVPMVVNGFGGAKHEDGEPIFLGARLLSDFDVEFDLAHNAIRLFKPDGCHGDEVLYWGGAYSMAQLIGNPEREYYFRIPVLLNGTSVEAKLDSESGYSWVSSGIASQVGAKPTPTFRRMEGETLITHPALFNTLTIDQEALKNVTLEVAELKQKFAADALGTRLGAVYSLQGMALGGDFLSAHRLIISNSQHGVYFTYAGGPVFKSHIEETAAK